MEEFTNIQVDFQHIPKSEEIKYTALHHKYLYILLINSAVVFTILICLLTYLWTVVKKEWFRDNFQWGISVILLLFVLEFMYTYKAFSFRGYAFRQKDISYKKGWMWRSLTTVPFNRVQHCEVNQGIFDRYFGLAKLKIFTAGGSASDLAIPGLTLQHASDLKDYILEKIKDDE